ncbi:hypothetical protein [Ruminiclostridium josui]|uniref:hypothetical protein n=1 Tax=Ruminiclostridium josui TaxID=1499 RepID=UPI000A818699|nr:hypothetical protein [Ruminiclostridium josui]
MKISLNWLKDYVDLEGIDIKELWYRFTMSTAEVENVEFVGQDIKNVVVAKVLSVVPHPESKKLKITQVDSGDGVIQIVCGAPNVAEGILVPLVKIGGSVKKIPKIGKAKLVELKVLVCCVLHQSWESAMITADFWFWRVIMHRELTLNQ